LFNSTFFNNLVSLKKHLLWLVEIELLVQFSQPFANTFSVVRYAKPTAIQNRNDKKLNEKIPYTTFYECLSFPIL
ncbi:hypothetical protein PGK46_10110, partial [Riemerella anatipestifer]